MKIHEDMRRHESHYAMLTSFFINLLDEMTKEQVEVMLRNSLEEAAEVHQQEKE